MPGHDFEVEGEEILEFICIICHSLIRQTCLLSCGHAACRECLTKWENEHEDGNAKCPTCGGAYDKDKVGQGKQGEFIDRVMTASINVKCKQHHLNCTWVGKIPEYDDHEQECQFFSLTCAFEGCNENIQRKNVVEHRQTCTYRTVLCKFCSIDVVFKDEKAHIEKCEEHEVTCSNDVCTVRMKRKELNNHVQFMCLYTVSPCCFKSIGCDFKVMRCDIEKHNKECHLLHTSLLTNEIQRLANQMNQQEFRFKQQFDQQEKISMQQFHEIKQLSEKLHQQEKHTLHIMREQRETFSQQLTQQQQQIERQQQQLSQQQRILQKLEQSQKQQQQDKNVEQLKKCTVHLGGKSSKMGMKDWTFDELKKLLVDERYDTFMDIVTKNPLVVNMKGEFKETKDATLLHVASYYNIIQCVIHLIENGAKINETAENGFQPIHHACKQGHLNIVTKLLQVDRNVIHAKDKHSLQPIHYACLEGHLKIVTELLEIDRNVIHAEDKYNSQPIHHASLKGNLNIVTKLLEVDRNVIHAEDKCNSQPMHYACINGHLNVVTKLMEVDPNVIYAKDIKNKEPIHYACENGHLNIVKILMGVDSKVIHSKYK